MPKQPPFDPALAAKLKRLRLRVDGPDADTLVLKSVPANHHCFSKARTNLLIRRIKQGMPCAVCVDENLEYTGADPELARVFAAGPLQNGWRILTFAGQLHGDLSAALEYALDILDAGQHSGGSPVPPSAPRRGLLAAWAKDLSSLVLAGLAVPTLGRHEEVEQVAAGLLSWQGRLPLILGGPGTGKSNLLSGVATVLAPRGTKLLAVNAGALMAGTLFESERENILLTLLREAADTGAVLALEQAEWVLSTPRAPALLRDALDGGARLVATSAPDRRTQFDTPPLGIRLEIVELRELGVEDACRVLESMRASLTAHHGVAIGAEVERAAVERALSMNGFLPGKAVGLLDAAAARARLTGSAEVTLMDVYLAASRILGEHA
jgi:ATP-dependent Clp protease ATP-binding subunit ClpA